MWRTAAVAALTALTCCGQPETDRTDLVPIAREVPPAGAPVVSRDPDLHAYRYGGPCPPPSLAEDRGPPPDPDHFWSAGYFLWSGHDHVWVPGGWYPRREGLAYVAPHWEEWHRRWHFVPGYWRPRRLGQDGGR